MCGVGQVDLYRTQVSIALSESRVDAPHIGRRQSLDGEDPDVHRVEHFGERIFRQG